MVQLLNAQERSESEWNEIVRAADAQLELTRIIVSTMFFVAPVARILRSITKFSNSWPLAMLLRIRTCWTFWQAYVIDDTVTDSVFV